MRAFRLGSRRGLTLIEVMVSIGILLVMSAVVVESLRNAITFQNLLGDRDELLRTARVAMERLGRDLQLAYLTPNRAAIERYQTVFVGTSDEPSELYFASLNHQRTILHSRECDQTEITVWGEQAAKDRGNGYVLYHREAPRIDQYPDEQGVIWPLAYNVRSFRVRYLDQATNEWKTEWDSRGSDTPYRLPRAVELGLILITPDPEDPTREATVDVPFLSRVIVEYGQPLPTAGAPFLPNAGGGYANVPVPIPGGIPPGGMLGGMAGGMGGMFGGGMGMPPGMGMPGASAQGPAGVRR